MDDRDLRVAREIRHVEGQHVRDAVGDRGQKSHRDLIDARNRTCNRLLEREKDYREISMVIVQVSVGFGGLLLGLVGLALSLLVPLLIH
jgi:hypothetical protein